MTPRSATAIASAALVAGVLLPFAPAVVGLRTLAHRDTDLLYAPVRTLVVEELRAGRLPLWNPYEGTGKPLFAEGIHSVLHPISLLGALVAPARIDFLILAWLVAAALGAFALARSLGASRVASVGAGLAYALSGYSVSMTGNLVFLAGLSGLPWLLAAARTAGAGARWGTVLTALATACALLSGDVQVAIVGVALGLLLAADAGGRRGALRASLGVAAGLLLAGVQIAASAGLVPHTFRSLELQPWERSRWPLDPARLLEWVVPGLVRGPLSAVPRGVSGVASTDPVFAESVYLGAPLLAAAALAVARRAAPRRRAALLLAGASVLLLWLALGDHLGARQALSWVPIWGRFRYAEKLMAPLSLCLAALAAVGVDAFAADRLTPRARRLLVAIGVASALALLSLLVLRDATRRAAEALLGDLGPFHRDTLAAGLPHLLVAVGALLALDRLGSPRRRAAALAALLALAPAAALRAAAPFGSVQARRAPSPLRLAADGPSPRLLQPEDRLQAVDDPRGPFDARAAIDAAVLGPCANVARRVDVIEPYGAFEPLRLTALARAFGDAWVQRFRRFGVTHVVLQTLPGVDSSAPLAGIAVAGGRRVQREASAGVEAWEVPHRPWAFFARSALAANDEGQALDALLDLAAHGEDTTVVVEAASPPPVAPGRVLRVERRAGGLSVEAEAEGPGLLVVQDAWWPGWRASIDGRPTEILAADFLVRAVRWPAGRHVLRMTYDPLEVRAGLALSALGAVLVLVLAAVALRAGAGGEPP